MMSLEIEFFRLEEDSIILTFDCGDDDLNDFLFNDAKNYFKHFLAITYIIQTKNETIAYFSLSSDALLHNNSKNWNKINRNIPNNKRRRSYPAVKIGRLAVSKNYEGRGFGRLIIARIKSMLLKESQYFASRFIVVDAYKNATLFYKKQGFKFLSNDDNCYTRQMYLDLKSLI